MPPRSNAVLQFPHKTTPILVNRKVPTRLKNADYRSREYLTEDEVEKLMDAAGRVGRHGHRDATLIMLAYRHGLRVTELVSLRWDQIDLKQGLLHINRLKQGNASVHPLRGPELRSLRRLQRDYPILPMYLLAREGRPLPMMPFGKSSHAQGLKPNCHSRYIHTCFVTPVATNLLRRAKTRVPFSITSVTRTFNIRFAIPSYRQNGLKTFGKTRERTNAISKTKAI
jgi:integrase